MLAVPFAARNFLGKIIYHVNHFALGPAATQGGGPTPAGILQESGAVRVVDGSSAKRDNFYRLTGEVIRGWAKLELCLSAWLIDLLGIDELRSRIVWDSYGDLRSKLKLLKVLTRNFADESLWKEANEIMADVETIAENRYILPHAFGDVDEAETTLTFASERADADFVINFLEEKAVGTSALRDWLDHIRDSQDRVTTFRSRLGTRVHQRSLMQRRSLNEVPS